MILLSNSTYYKLYQAEGERSYYVDLGQKRVRMTFCQLLALRQKMIAISPASLFDAETHTHDFSIVTLCNNEHLFLFDTLQILDLRNLLQNGFAAMGLSKSIVPLIA